MRVVSKTTSASATLLRRLATDSDILNSSELVLHWGVPGGGLGGTRGLNAVEQLRAMQAANVRVPEFSLTRPADPRGWWGRRLIHTQGRDIRDPVRQPRGFRESEFWVRFILSETEYRYHIFQGRSIARAQKVPGPTLDPTLPPVSRTDIRNRRTGWRLLHKCPSVQGLREVAKAAVAACGYHFGAVDILVTTDGPVVLEVNRAPGLDECTGMAYIRALERMVQQ